MAKCRTYSTAIAATPFVVFVWATPSLAAMGPPADAIEPGGLHVAADRDRLQLGVDNEAALDLRGPRDMVDVRVTTQAGRVVDVVKVAPGRFTARYLAPRETYPQIAILAASARCGAGSAHGWLALPLWGSGTATLRTRRGLSVGVDIAGARFGPVRADRDGIAIVPVQVPPGVRYGHDGRKPIDLKLPPMLRTHVALDRDAVRADRSETIALRVFAVDETGAPLARVPELATSRGRLSPPRSVAPGSWETELALEPGTAGPVEVSARAKGSPAAVASVMAVAGTAASVRVVLPEAPNVGPAAVLEVRVAVTDASGNPAGGEIRLATNLGVMEPPRPDGPGAWIALCRVPENFAGRDQLRVEARADGERGEINDVAVRPLAPGAPAVVSIRAPGGALADGSTPVNIGVDVRDRHGNRVAQAPSASASSGAIETVERGGEGFVVRWTPASEEDPTVGDIAVRAGAAERRAEIRLRPRPRRMTVAAKGGALHGTGNLSLLSVAGEGGVGVPAFGQPTWVLVEAGYQRGDASEPIGSGALAGERATSETQILSLIASVGWRPRLGRWLVPSATLGGGVLLVHNRLGVSGQPEVVDRQAAAVVRGALGLGVRLGPGQAFLEGSYRFSADADRSSLSGPLSAAGVHFGYALELF